MFHVPEKYRVRKGELASDWRACNNGAFEIKTIKFKRPLRCIASDGAGWEHVSVSLHDRCPTWEEMCFVKGVFWDDEDTVLQFHPKRSSYVNVHNFCLHLWRQTDKEIDLPPSILVGVKS